MPRPDLLGRRRRIARVTHRPVVRLHLGPEAIRVRGPGPLASAHDHDAARPEQLMRLGVPQVRIDPMQRADGHDGVNRGMRGFPVLERARHHVDGRKARQPAPPDVGQLRAELDRRDGQPALRQRHGGLPGAAADLDHPVSRSQPGQPHQVVEQR